MAMGSSLRQIDDQILTRQMELLNGRLYQSHWSTNRKDHMSTVMSWCHVCICSLNCFSNIFARSILVTSDFDESDFQDFCDNLDPNPFLEPAPFRSRQALSVSVTRGSLKVLWERNRDTCSFRPWSAWMILLKGSSRAILAGLMNTHDTCRWICSALRRV